MNFRTASLVSLLVLTLVGAVFLVLSFGLPLNEPGVVIGSGYFPRVLCFVLFAASAVGFVQGFRRKGDAALRIKIERPLFFGLVLLLAVLLAGVWHATGSFYPVCAAVSLVMLWVLNPEPPGGKKAGKTLLAAALLMAFVYIVFGLLLQLKL